MSEETQDLVERGETQAWEEFCLRLGATLGYLSRPGSMTRLTRALREERLYPGYIRELRDRLAGALSAAEQE
jgi:hypothetical protein